MSPTFGGSGLGAARRLLLLLTFSISLLTSASAQHGWSSTGFTYPNETAPEDNGLTYNLGDDIKFDWSVPFLSVNLAFVAQDAGQYRFLAYRWVEPTFTWTVDVNGSHYRKPYFFMYIENAENPNEHFWSARFRVEVPHHAPKPTASTGSEPGPSMSSTNGPVGGGSSVTSGFFTSSTSTARTFVPSSSTSSTSTSGTSTSGASTAGASAPGIPASGTSSSGASTSTASTTSSSLGTSISSTSTSSSASSSNPSSAPSTTATTLTTGSAPPAVATPGDGKPGEVQPGDTSPTGVSLSAGAPWNGAVPSGGQQNSTVSGGAGGNGDGNGDGGTTTDSSGISSSPTDSPSSIDPSSTPDPSTTSTPAEPNTTQAPEVHKSLSAGQTAGAAVGAIAGAAVLSAAAFFVFRRTSRKDEAAQDRRGAGSSSSGRYMHQAVSEPILEDSTVYAGADDHLGAYHDPAWMNGPQRGTMWPAPLQPQNANGHTGRVSPVMTQLQPPASALNMNPPTPGYPLPPAAGAMPRPHEMEPGMTPAPPPLSAAPRAVVSNYTLGRYDFERERPLQRQTSGGNGGVPSYYYMGPEQDDYYHHPVPNHMTPWYGTER